MFVAISYQVDGTDSYAKGIKDLSFVFFYMIFFTFLREFLMDVVIRPFTVYLNVTSEHRQKRMLEQMYAIFYCGVSGPFGLYIMYHSDLWLFKTKPMYRTYPDIINPFLFKIFYLGQAAFGATGLCSCSTIRKAKKGLQGIGFSSHCDIIINLVIICFPFYQNGIGYLYYYGCVRFFSFFV